MPPPFEELDRQKTPLGELVLRRRRVLALGGETVWEVKLAGDLLMSSLVNDSERALAGLALAALGGRPADVLIGGLGLGHTVAAALAAPGVRSLTVVELLPAVIEWHRCGLVPLGKELSRDPRCRFVAGDFFALLSSPAGLEAPPVPGAALARWDAVLIDIDHTPDSLLHPSHARFYEPAGLRRAAERLRPGGVLALWSADPPAPGFTARLEAAFASARAHPITFFNPLTTEDEVNTVYVARVAT